MKRLGVLLLFVALTASGAEPNEEVRRAVGPRDFFLYACVSEFARAHDFPRYDNSVGYAVEFSTLDPEEMSRLHDAAKTFARSLRAPDPSDEEHGGVAVVALCLEEARSTRVDALLVRERKSKE